MKRSDAVKIIQDLVWDYVTLRRDNYQQQQFASDLLDVLEKYGMLPPAHRKIDSQGNGWMDRAWETEDSISESMFVKAGVTFNGETLYRKVK